MPSIEQTACIEILTFIAGALLFVGVGASVSSLLRPQPAGSAMPTYEAGEVPMGSAWKRFNARCHVISLVFLLFEVEAVLLFPWATVWASPALNAATGGWWPRYAAVAALLFIALLALGLAYVWRQGHLASIPPPPAPTFAAKVPPQCYAQVNNRHATKSPKPTNVPHK